MVGRLFKTGKCRKFEFFDILISEIKEAGWKDISSNPDGDFIVMNSKGEQGDKNLILQIRDWNITNASTSSVRTTDSSSFGVRMPLGYVPDEGHRVSGVFQRPNTTWNFAYVYPVSTNANSASMYDKNVRIDYAIAADKDNIIYVITPAIATTYGSIVTFMGLPDERHTLEENSDGCIFASTFGNGYAANTVSVANNCSEMNVQAADISNRAMKATLAVHNPNAAGLYALADIGYESTSEGLRGKLNSILFLPNINILNNDVVMDGEHKYKIAICQAVTAFAFNSFPTQAIVYRIE